jgi:hypothetical protein
MLEKNITPATKEKIIEALGQVHYILLYIRKLLDEVQEK